MSGGENTSGRASCRKKKLRTLPLEISFYMSLLRLSTVLGSALVFLGSFSATGQLQAFAGKTGDNNCREFYLVNPGSNIYYVAGLSQNRLQDCQTFSSKVQGQSRRFRVNVSTNERDFLLLLPKDTIAYSILIPSEFQRTEKELSVLIRLSPSVINSNKDKKRNRQILRLPSERLNLFIIEK